MIPIVKRDIREIPIELIDRPELAMRDSFDLDELEQLKASILANGIRVALIVVARDGRYKVVAGDRRLAAAAALGAVTVPCDVQELDEDELEFVKVLENEDRAPVNAAEAAAYFMRLFREKCGEDVDQVCARVRRDRRYVEDRLLLFTGDEHVFEALKLGQITLGVAQQLNLITDRNYRLNILDDAQKYGMTIAAAKERRKSANFATGSASAPPANGDGSAVSATPTAPVRDLCYICHRGDKPERFRLVLIHEHCDLAIGQRVLSAFREPDVEPGTANA